MVRNSRVKLEALHSHDENDEERTPIGRGYEQQVIRDRILDPGPRIPDTARYPGHRALSLFERYEGLRVLRTDVIGARANEPVVRVLLQAVRRPARDPAHGEERREEIDR